MKVISPELATDIAKGATTLCQAFELTRKDGTVYRRSTHTRSIIFETHVFKPGGFEPTDVSSTFEGQIADVEILSYFDGELTEDDVRNGRLDDATGRIVWANWDAPSHGTMPMFKGIVSAVAITDDRTAVRFTISGRLSTLTGRMGEIRSATCRAIFGDDRCKVPIEDLKLTCAVVTLVDNVLTVSTADGFPFDPSDHAYWRLEVSRRIGSYGFIAEIEFRATTGGAQAATGGTAIASRNDDYSGPPANAFDADSVTGWKFNEFDASIGYHFAAPITIKEFTIKTKEAIVGVESAALAYSDDGITWSRVQGGYFDGLTWTAGETKVFTPATSNSVTPAMAFQFGIVKFTTGANAGESFTISSYFRVSDTITLHLMLRPLFAIAVDDVVLVYPGCDLTLLRCKFYNNVVNMRAEPYTPTALYQGQNKVLT